MCEAISLLAGQVLGRVRVMLAPIFMSKVVLPSLSDQKQQIAENDYNDDANKKKILLKKTYRLWILRGHS